MVQTQPDYMLVVFINVMAYYNSKELKKIVINIWTESLPLLKERTASHVFYWDLSLIISIELRFLFLK